MIAWLASTLFSWILAAITVVFAVPAAAWLIVATWLAVSGSWPSSPAPDQWWLAGGISAGVLFALWQRPNAFLHTWLHEHAHLLMAKLLWVRVGELQITDGRGGHVAYDQVDPLRRIPILTAPYVLPLALLPVLLARWVCPEGLLRMLLSAACGAFLVFHLHGLWHNLRLNFFGAEADITKVGKPLSLALIVVGLELLAALAVYILFQHQSPTWWQSLFHTAPT